MLQGRHDRHIHFFRRLCGIANIRAFINLVNIGVMAALAVGFLIWPSIYATRIITSGALHSVDIPDFAYGWHRRLSKDLAPWARERVASGRAQEHETGDIAGTEWPLFSSVFYLWSTEALQEAALADGVVPTEQPAVYARDAIEAAARLIADPGHATWVRAHWGEDYLLRENLFYRMLLISGLTSYQNLTGDASYAVALALQVTSLAAELDASPFGLLDDYPGECYPIDILPAIAALKRADSTLGTDHSAVIERARRGFEGSRLDALTGLPSYTANSRTGEGKGHARGVGVAFMTIWAAEVWPDVAARWYPEFDRHFWTMGRWVGGFREYPRAVAQPALLMDVDAGPVVFGLGTTASAFGIGAARTQGRLDHAYVLGAQAFATMMPTGTGRLLVPRALSSITDAPFTGEAIMLFNFTRRPQSSVQMEHSSADLPLGVFAALAAMFTLGLLVVLLALKRWRKELRAKARNSQGAQLQMMVWIALVCASLLAFARSEFAWALMCLFAAQLLPRYSAPRVD